MSSYNSALLFIGMHCWSLTECSVKHDGTEPRSLKRFSWEASSASRGREGGQGLCVVDGGGKSEIW